MTARVLAACLLLALPVPAARERDVGVLVIHRVNNFLGHLAAWELANRGFVVLAMNSRFDNNEAGVLRNLPGSRKLPPEFWQSWQFWQFWQCEIRPGHRPEPNV